MPSTIVGYPLASGAQRLVSGCHWDGAQSKPVGSMLLRLSPDASGKVFVGLSGGMTLNSGGAFLSGGGLADGMPLSPGDSYSLPKLAFNHSGQINVFLHCEPECSGQARMYYEIF